MENRREHILNTSDLLVDKLEDGQLEIRKVIVVDGEEVYHRHVLIPGHDTGEEDPRVKVIAAQEHTPRVVAAFWEAQRARENG